MSQQTLTAFFDSRSEANTAVESLVAAGIMRSHITIVPGNESGATTATSTTTSYDRDRDEGGFWASLKDLFLPDEDRYTYAEGLNRGGVIVTAKVDDSHADRAADILEEHGSVDLDDRETSWRSEGWSGYQGSSTGSALGAAAGMAGSSGYMSGSEAMGSGTTGASGSTTTGLGLTGAGSTS